VKEARRKSDGGTGFTGWQKGLESPCNPNRRGTSCCKGKAGVGKPKTVGFEGYDMGEGKGPGNYSPYSFSSNLFFGERNRFLEKNPSWSCVVVSSLL